MKTLKGKVAIITGASSGIGYETAKLFAREGARLVLVARGRAGLDALLAELAADDAEAVAHAGDVADEACAKAAVDLALARFGGLDIAFNNAGTLGAMRPTPELTLTEWLEAIDINLTSAFLAAKYQLPAMAARGGGSLIYTSSFVGHAVGMPGMAAYATSKSGLIGLTRTLASEFGAQGIRVNAILPGGTDTPLGREVANTPEARAFVESLHSLKRIARPDEIAQSVLYLASDASSFTTGSAMLVDGGASISKT